MGLSDRRRKILSAVIKAYIETGEPIGSKFLISREKFDLSSATVRNEMNELEKEGLIQKPHASAGRIPTNEGYRFYVSNSLSGYELSPYEITVLETAFRKGNTMEDTVREMTVGMAKFSGCTVFTLAPMCSDGKFSFKVFPVNKKTFGIMAISSENSVKSCFIKTQSEIFFEDCTFLEKLLNETFSEISSSSAPSQKFKDFESSLKRYCPVFAEEAESLERFIGKLKNFELYMSGTSNLFSYPEFSQMETAKKFMNFINEEEEIKKNLLESFYNNGITIRIGEENKLFPNPNSSMISLRRAGKFPLIIGVMGPTRMYYSRIISGCNHLLNEIEKLWGDS